MRVFLFSVLLCLPFLSYGQFKTLQPICLGKAIDFDTLCPGGKAIVQGNVDFKNPGKYSFKEWCVDNGDTSYLGLFYLTIDPKPIVVLDPIPVLCHKDSPISLYRSATPYGGLFSTPDAQGALTGTQLSPAIDPSKVKPGIYHIIYSYTSKQSAKCTSSDTQILIIKDCTWKERYYSRCLGDTSKIDFTCDSGNTTIVDGSVNYKARGLYKLARWCIKSNGDTASKDSFFVSIHSPPKVNVGPIPIICKNSRAVNLSAFASPKGGHFYSPDFSKGIKEDLLYPDSVGEGNYRLIYQYTDSVTKCSNLDTAILKIRACIKRTYIICVGNNVNLNSGCFKGKSVVEGKVDLQHTGIYPFRHLCINNGDTLTIDSCIADVVPLPTMNADTLPDLCDNDPAFSLQNYGNPLSGQWYSKTKPFGVISNTLYPDALKAGTHWLTYRYTDPKTGCYNNDSTTITIKPCAASLDDVGGQNQIEIYPNPAKDYLIVSGINGNADITLITALGIERKIVLKSGRISLENIPSGVFFIRIRSGSQITVQQGMKLP